MPSPDLDVVYRDLTLYDRTPADLVDRALLDKAAKMPTWEPRPGDTALVLLEAAALVVAELGYAINRVPDAVVEVLLRLFEITRSLGAPPTAAAEFTLSTAAGFEVPAGTVVRLLVADEPLDFTTDVAVAAPPGTTTVTAAITADRNTDDANGTAAGTTLELITPLPFVDAVELSAPVTAGADAEDESDWRNRAMLKFSRLNSTLALPEHFTAAALERTGVYRARTIDNYNGAAPAAGHVTVAVLGSGGATLSAGDKAALEADLEAAALANLDVHVVDPTITAVPVTVEVAALPGYSTAEVIAAVTAALNAYLSPDAWEWGGTVRYNELVARIDAAEGVDYVVDNGLTAPAGDVALPGVAPLADLGAVTVTVT